MLVPYMLVAIIGDTDMNFQLAIFPGPMYLVLSLTCRQSTVLMQSFPAATALVYC